MYLQADRAITFPVIMGLAQKRICLACRPSNFAVKMPMKLVMYSTITVPIEPVQYSWAAKPKLTYFRPILSWSSAGCYFNAAKALLHPSKFVLKIQQNSSPHVTCLNLLLILP